ncbi:MAG: hypothetical protein AAGA48_21060 [Myxococcota bacterium]
MITLFMTVFACGGDEAPGVATGCSIGETVACTCADGSPGLQSCVAPPEGFSTCGCASDGEGLFVPLPEPEPMVCQLPSGEVECPPYRGDDVTEAGAKHCCTATDACGSQSDFIFGEQCIPRDGERGVPSTECPDEFPNFLDLFGCCRSDGQCGLSVDHVSNWDIGCLERSEMAALLNEGSRERDVLSLVFFLPVEDAVFESIDCTP